MRIAIVTAYFQPELGYEEYYIARNLTRLGHEVSIITSDRIFPFMNYKKLLEEIGSEYTTRKRGRGVSELDGFTVYRLPCVIEFLTDFILILNLRAALKKVRPDIVHLHEAIEGGSAVAALHKDLGFKLLVEQHGYATTFDSTFTLKNNIAHYLFMFFRKPAANIAYKRADAITAVNEEARQFMAKVQKIPIKKIDVVPLGTDMGQFKFNRASRKRIRKELGVQPETTLILTAGRIDRAKKLEQLIKAFDKVQKGQEAKLVIIGSGDDEYKDSLKLLVSKLGLEKKVKFIKFLPKTSLPDYYSAADIGFWNKASITILESMCCKLPVVLPEQETIRFYTANKNGLLFTEDDVDALFDKLNTLVTDPALRKDMGKRGCELVERDFSYKATTRKYLKIYKRMMKQ